MAWRIELQPRALKELEAQDRQVQRRLLTFLRERLAPLDDPRSIGDALHGPVLGRFWKYRVGGEWRLVCEIQDGRITILVLRVGHRREVHRG